MIKKENNIDKYFYNFCCYLIVNNLDGYLNYETEQKRGNYINNMLELSRSSLNNIDERFGKMALDLENSLVTKTEINSELIEYKDFILSFQN